jgi:hypothetical protein
LLAVAAAAAAPAPAAAQPASNPSGAAPSVTAEEAIDVQHRRLQAATGTAPCERDSPADEILVCGRRGPDPNRVPFPEERLPGERVALLPGEPPSALAALRSTAGSPCSTVGPSQHCSAGLPVVGVLTTLFKIGKHLLGGDD